jgi:NDP-sugar pyrophosphorylase family protein
MPKTMTDVGGEPFVFHQLRLLSEHGARDIVLCVGHLGEIVQEQVGPERFGLRIEYSFDAENLDGTLGAIRGARRLLGDRFLVLYGDTYLRIDYRAFSDAWLESGLDGGMAVLHNHGNWDQSNAVYADGRVLRYEKGSDDPSMEWIDYGLGALRADGLDAVDESQRDLSSLYRELSKQSQLFGYVAKKRFYEIGTPGALAETTQFLAGITKGYDSDQAAE